MLCISMLQKVCPSCDGSSQMQRRYVFTHVTCWIGTVNCIFIASTWLLLLFCCYCCLQQLAAKKHLQYSMAAATGTGTPAAESFVCRAAEGTTTTTTKRLMPNSS